MNRDDERGRATTRELLREHRPDCPECADDAFLERDEARLERLLSSSVVPDAEPARASVAALSAAVLDLAAPVLARRAIELYRKRVAAALLVVLAPVPLVYAFGSYALTGVYAALSTVVPGNFAAYAVGSYAAALVLLIALTCAAIPLLVERSLPVRITA